MEGEGPNDKAPGPSMKEMLDKMMNGEEDIEKLLNDSDITEDEILELQKLMNPYAYVVPGQGSDDVVRGLALSYTNLREEYLRNFLTTSLVGFIFRMRDEWTVPVEKRRWTPRSSKKKKRPPPYTPGELLKHAEALCEVAKLAKEAENEAEAARRAATELDLVFSEEEMKSGKGADKIVAAQKAMREADVKIAKAHGLQYSVTYKFRQLGQECDQRIDELGRLARQHEQVRAIIDKHPLDRPPLGQQEMPEPVAKGIISDFLSAWFEFNPDAHVRSAYDEFVVERDLGRSPVPGLGELPVDRADPERLPLSVLQAPPPTPAPEDAEVHALLTADARARNALCHFLRDADQAEAAAKILASPEASERFRRYFFPVPPRSPARPAVDAVPPADTLHRWKYYEEVNTEELRSATDAIYHTKPDLDVAIIPYEAFEGTREQIKEEFAKFRDLHQDEVISSILMIDFNGWSLLSSLKGNRKKIHFLNKHTDILKRILDRHAEDKKLGRELMRDRVKKLKAKNIAEVGPDAPGLKDYKAQVGNLSGVGAEKVISAEEMKRLERARGSRKAAQELEVLDQCLATIQELSELAKRRQLSSEEKIRLQNAQKDKIRAEEMLEVPEDAIQVDVFTHDTKGGKLEKSKFYTKAEAPEYLRAGARDAPRGPASGAASTAEPSGGRKGLTSSAVDASRIDPRTLIPPSARDNHGKLAPFAEELLARERQAERQDLEAAAATASSTAAISSTSAPGPVPPPQLQE